MEYGAIPGTGNTCDCPGCGYQDPKGRRFAICPRCGLVIDKFLKRQEQQGRGEEEPVTQAPDVAPAASPSGFSSLARLILSRRNIVACGLCVLLAIGIVAWKFAPLTRQDKREPEQEQAVKLHEAVRKGKSGKVRTLLFLGANPNAEVNGQTHLETAVIENEFDIAGILVQSGAKLRAGQDNRPDLFLKMVNSDMTRHAIYLLNIGADANAAQYGNNSALMIAAANGNKELLSALLDKGADINAVNDRGFTALLNAASHGRLDVMKILLERGAQVSPRAANGITPLRIARDNRNAQMIDLLQNAGAIE